MDNRLYESLNRLCEDALDDYLDELDAKYDKRDSGEEQPVTYSTRATNIVNATRNGSERGRKLTKSEWDRFYKWLSEVKSEYDIEIDFLEEDNHYVGITGYKEDVEQFIHDFNIEGTELYADWGVGNKS